MSVPSRIILSTPTRQYLARSCTRSTLITTKAARAATPTSSSLVHKRSFNCHQPSQQATLSEANNNINDGLLSTNNFDPPRQISRILSHYCREPQMVMIEGYGILQGEMDKSRLLTRYLNVPFAKVQDRFQQAVAPEPWKGIRDATLYGPMCPQNAQESNSLSTMMLGLPGPGFEYSERDCLNLNVFAPRCVVNHVPVICYIHGGLSQGGIALPKHDATNIVKKSVTKGLPVIVVTINYRLLPSAGLLENPDSKKHGASDDDNDASSFNWGLYDQKIALEWVRKHIHNFGGNPDEITLMGHSSGASTAGYHMLTTSEQQNGSNSDGDKKKDKRLFKRAIMHSGSRPTTTTREEDTRPLNSLLGDMVPVGSPATSASAARTAIETRSVESNEDREQLMFTFMSDACLPHMDEKEKQAGWRVVDRWIDFAWGQEGDSTSESVRRS